MLHNRHLSKDEVAKCLNVCRTLLEDVFKSEQNIYLMKSLLEDAFDIIVHGRAPSTFMAADEGPLESVKGVRNSRVETINSGMILPVFLEAHEQRGHHPLLLSGTSQARMVFAKDMRERNIHFKDQAGFLDVHRVEECFLVVCISHFPSGAMNSYDFGDAVGGMGFREDVLHTLEPHITLVAHPAALEPRTDSEQATTHTASCDLENFWRHRKRASSFPDMSHQTLHELVTDGRTLRQLRLRRSSDTSERYIDDTRKKSHSAKRRNSWRSTVLKYMTLSTTDRCGSTQVFHQQTMMGIAANLDTKQVDSLASEFTLVGWFGTGATAGSRLVPPIETQTCSCKNALQTRCDRGGRWQVDRRRGQTRHRISLSPFVPRMVQIAQWADAEARAKGIAVVNSTSVKSQYDDRTPNRKPGPKKAPRAKTDSGTRPYFGFLESLDAPRLTSMVVGLLTVSSV